MKYQAAAEKAAMLVSGDRAHVHGEARENHERIAALWNAYLRIGAVGGQVTLTHKDVALMMALLKIARTTFGAHNADDYVDGCGYLSIAGAIAQRDADVAENIKVCVASLDALDTPTSPEI